MPVVMADLSIPFSWARKRIENILGTFVFVSGESFDINLFVYVSDAIDHL